MFLNILNCSIAIGIRTILYNSLKFLLSKVANMRYFDIFAANKNILKMGRLGNNFKRFPHTCEIYTMVGVTDFSDGRKQTIWQGVCRKERMSDSTGRDSVIVADYRIQLGTIENGKEIGAIVPGIKSGMIIDVTDMQGSFSLTVKDAYAGQIGTSVFADAGAYAVR